jgi:fused signal recognition particle receptor
MTIKAMFGFFKSKSKEKVQDAIVPPVEDSQATVAQEEVAVAESQSAEQPQVETVVEAPAEVVPEAVAAPAVEAEAPQEPEPIVEAAMESVGVAEPEPVVEEQPVKKGWLARLKDGLSKTRTSFTEGLADLVLGKKEIDDDLLEELETQLLMADVGVEATQQIITNLTAKVSRKELNDSEALFTALKQEMRALLGNSDTPLQIDSSQSPYVILMVGINGAGKTTTIGKLAKRLQLDGKSVMLAAGDTFRAAAVEQLQEWGRRNDIPVIAQHSGADSASVIYDAVQAAKSRGVDVLIADTAGRLHTQTNLMEELKKVKRVMGKLDVSAPHEVMLVVDAGTGQNALMQAEQFDQAVGLTGITLTKLDGTAKGGIVFAIAKKFGFPIRFIGVGESIDDLRVFNGDDFVNALLDRSE